MNNKPTCLIKVDDSNWQPARVYHNGLAQNHYIRFMADGTNVTIYGRKQELIKVLCTLLSLIDPPQTGLQNDIDTSTITPEEVIDFFRNSPVLAEMADDVEMVLRPLVEIGNQSDLAIVRSKLDVSTLFDNGQPVRGAQADIARALAIPNAGSYRKRILNVLNQLNNSTTTQKTTLNGRAA